MKRTFFIFIVPVLLTTGLFSQSVNELNSPFSSTVRVLYMSNTNTLFAGGDFGFFKTTDLGQIWDTVLTENTRSIYIHNDHTWYLCTYGGIFRTTDSGGQWIPFGQSLPTFLINDIAINKNHNSIFAATNSGVFKSTDEGNNWIISLNCSSSNYPNIECINDTILFLGKSSSTNNYDNLIRSNDNGNNWEVVDLGSFIGRLYKTPENILFLEWKFLTETKLYKSTNRGNNWQLIYAPSGINYFGPWTTALNNSLIMQKNYWMNAGAYGVLLLVSFNNLQTVTQYNLWLTMGDELISSITTNPNEDIIAGLNNGKIRKISGINLTGIDEEPVINPTQYKLSQNYPNPFNPSTKISWQSPVSGWQTLKVYDVLGNEITVLVNEEKSSGSYEINFDAGKLSSGVYYYQLRTGDPSTGSGQGFVETKKMILIK